MALDLDKGEIRRIYIEEINILDRELESILKDKMSSVKTEIQQIASKKQANLGYANINRGSNFFLREFNIINGELLVSYFTERRLIEMG